MRSLKTVNRNGDLAYARDESSTNPLLSQLTSPGHNAAKHPAIDDFCRDLVPIITQVKFTPDKSDFLDSQIGLAHVRV